MKNLRIGSSGDLGNVTDTSGDAWESVRPEGLRDVTRSDHLRRVLTVGERAFGTSRRVWDDDRQTRDRGEPMGKKARRRKARKKSKSNHGRRPNS